VKDVQLWLSFWRTLYSWVSLSGAVPARNFTRISAELWCQARGFRCNEKPMAAQPGCRGLETDCLVLSLAHMLSNGVDWCGLNANLSLTPSFALS
jgi:hypothetical protein